MRGVEAFADRLGQIGWAALAIAAGCHLAKLVARSRAWSNVLAEAYPDERVRWRSVFGGYAAGVAVNAVLPARSGDLLRLYIVKHRVRGATYPTLASSLLVEAVFDTLAATALVVWAVSLGVLPGTDALPRLPAIDWFWVFQHPRLATAVGLAAAAVALVLLVSARPRWRAFRARVAQGVVILRRPRRYLRRVLVWQLLDWALRLTTIYFVLRAFDVAPTAHNVLLVQVTQSVSTILPLTPGGLGTEQALLVYVLRGTEPVTEVLSFSVGMRVVLTVVNVLVGFTAIGLMLRTFRWWRRIAADAPDAAER